MSKREKPVYCRQGGEISGVDFDFFFLKALCELSHGLFSGFTELLFVQNGWNLEVCPLFIGPLCVISVTLTLEAVFRQTSLISRTKKPPLEITSTQPHWCGSPGGTSQPTRKPREEVAFRVAYRPHYCNSVFCANASWLLPTLNLFIFLKTSFAVTDLLKLACSSAMPGGGTNLELAVHCLHEAQGNILVRYNEQRFPRCIASKNSQQFTGLHLSKLIQWNNHFAFHLVF